jgi:transcriptional regulator
MYVPGYQSEQDPDRLWATVERYSFASLICAGDDGLPLSTLVPFVRRDERLYTHLAAANPQGALMADGRPVLCQFLGPHAYVSPTLYERAGEVPTWNYVQVRIAGRLRALDPQRSRWVVEQTVLEHERHRDDPVGPDWMSKRIDRLLGGIRAFEVLVESVTGRFKLSQNRGERDRQAIADELRLGGEAERGVAELMAHELGD